MVAMGTLMERWRPDCCLLNSYTDFEMLSDMQLILFMQRNMQPVAVASVVSLFDIDRFADSASCEDAVSE